MIQSLKNKLFFLLSSLITFSAFAQEDDKIKVTGHVVDAANKSSLPYVTVALRIFSTDSIFTGTITDDQGRFIIEGISTGKYTLNISYLGYTPVNETLVVSGLNPTYDFGMIGLDASVESLNEVQILADRATVSSALDKKSFQLDQNLAQVGGSVLDAMKAMPGVAFDQEGKIVLRGSDKVIVLIDGKQSSLTGFGNQKGLANIPAANIERIEIINNPSAKYDANGFAGIVNIIYKKEKKTGLNGDLGLSFGLGAINKRNEDTPTDFGSYSVNPKLIPSLNLNYRTGKLNYFLQSEFIVQQALPNNEFTTRFYEDGRTIVSQVPENRKQFRSIITGGIDWELNESDAVTFTGMYDREKHIDTSQVAFIEQNQNVSNRLYTWKEEEITSYINIAANYKHRFKEAGHSLSANAQYTRGLEDESYFLNDSSAVRIGRDMTNIRAIEHTTSLSTDYVQALSNGRIEIGAKARFRSLPVDYTTKRGDNSIIYPDLGDYSKWNEDLIAGYVNYLLEQEKFDIETGLRAENTSVSYKLDPANTYYPNNDSYSYFEFFPSVRFTFKPNISHKISIFYNRRIDRPGEPELRIFPKYDDPELLKVGNPYLRPQFTNSFEVAHRYNWGSGSIFSALYYRSIKDAYQRIYSIDDSNPDYDIVNRIYQNTGSSTNTGVELLFSQEIADYWKLSATFNGYINKLKAYECTLLFPYERPFFIEKSSNPASNFKVTNTFAFAKAWEAQISGVFYSKRNIPQGEELARSSVDLGLKKSFWEKRASVNLSVTDLLNRFGLRQNINGAGFSARYENLYETQVVRLGFNYKF